MQAIDYFLGHANKIFDQERLGDEIFNAVHHGAQFFLDVGAARHEKKRDVARGFAAAKLFEELAAIEAGHLVIAKDDVGGFVDHFQ